MTLDDIEKLIAAATPGPWKTYNAGFAVMALEQPEYSNGVAAIAEAAARDVDVQAARDNAAFIAASRELMPRMLKALRTLEWIAEHSIIECGRWTEAVMKSREALAELEQP